MKAQSTSKWVLYAIALIQTWLIVLLCLEWDEQGRLRSRDDPPLSAIALLMSGTSLVLGIQIPRSIVTAALHLPESATPKDDE